MLKAIGRVFAIGVIVGGTFGAGVATEKYRDSRAKQEWPSESWQEVESDKYYVISPPGSMWVFEIDEIDGKLQWRQLLMPIPKEWSASAEDPAEDPEERFRKRREFDKRWGQDQSENTVEAAAESAKKKKPDKTIDGIHTDSNGDGILEFDFPLLEEEGSNGAMLYYTKWSHGCCTCSLWHDVTLVLYYSGYQWRIHQRWEVDPKKTRWQRKKRWGCDPFMPDDCQPPFSDPSLRRDDFR